MSTKKMADFTYALIMTDAQLRGSFGIGIKQYNRKQNAYNRVKVMIFINPDNVEKFEELTGLTLKEPIQIILSKTN